MYIEDELEQFMFNKNFTKEKQQKEKVRNNQKSCLQQGKKIKKNNKKQDNNELNSIQEMNFKYIWNYLRGNQESTKIEVQDIMKAAQAVLKKPILEEQIIEMFNMNNEQLYIEDGELVNFIDEEGLREIFKECKLKI